MMTKYFGLFLLACALTKVHGFAPSPIQHRSSSNTRLPMAEDDSSSGGAIVPVNEGTIEFSAGTIGTALGLFIGGPVLGGITGVAANYVARKDFDTASDAIKNVSEGAIGVYNSATGLGGQAIDALKSNSPDVADALSTVEEKMDEYDVLDIAEKGLSTIGDVAESIIDKLLAFAEDQGLADKAAKVVDEAKSAADKAMK